MKAFGFLFGPIIVAMIGMHVWARAESVPKTVSHKTAGFVISGSILENCRGDKYNMTITAKRPIWVLVAGYPKKDEVIRLYPKQTLKLSNESIPGAVTIGQLNCDIRILDNDELFEYRAC